MLYKVSKDMKIVLELNTNISHYRIQVYVMKRNSYRNYV